MLSAKQERMVAVFESHVGAELAGDLDTTMATMSDDPYLNHVPTMAAGMGREGVRTFYRDHLVGKFFPPDVEMVGVSRTVGEDRIVDEIFISFTHTAVIDWLLPGVAPTGKPVEMAVAVVVGFEDERISYEMNLAGAGMDDLAPLPCRMMPVLQRAALECVGGVPARLVDGDELAGGKPQAGKVERRLPGFQIACVERGHEVVEAFSGGGDGCSVFCRDAIGHGGCAFPVRYVF